MTRRVRYAATLTRRDRDARLAALWKSAHSAGVQSGALIAEPDEVKPTGPVPQRFCALTRK